MYKEEGVVGHDIIIKNIYKIVLAGFMISFFMSSILYSYKFVFRMALGFVCFGVLTITLLYVEKNIARKNDAIIASVLIILVFVTRSAYSIFAANRVEQVSDFQLAIELVRSGTIVDPMYYMMAPYKLIYPYVLRFLGFSGNQLPLFIFQSMLAAVTALGIYLTAKELGDSRYGVVGIFLYLVWPSQLFYTSVFTEEHFAATVTIFIIYFYSCILRQIDSAEESLSAKTVRQVMVDSIIIGVLCGISIMLKDWGIIIVIAIIMTMPLFLIKRMKWGKVLLILLSFVLIIAVRTGIHQGMLNFVSERVGEGIPDNGIYLHMYTSLDPDGTLSHNEELGNEYVELFINNEYDLDKTHKMALDVIKQRIEKDPIGFIKLLLLKASRSYISGDQEIIEWAYVEYKEDERMKIYPMITIAQEIDYIFYAGMVVMIIVATLLEKRANFFFVVLVIIGAMSSQLLIESQGRYKYSVEPLWCVATVIGIFCLKQIIQKSMRKNDKKR